MVSFGNADNLISRKWFALSRGNLPKPPQMAASFIKRTLRREPAGPIAATVR
jgi:hypothetical protein